MIHSRRGQQHFLWMIRNCGHAPGPLCTPHLLHIQTPKFPQLPALMIPKVRSTLRAHTVKEKKPLPTQCGQRNKTPHTKWARNSPASRRGRRRNPAATRRGRRRRRRNSAASSEEDHGIQQQTDEEEDGIRQRQKTRKKSEFGRIKTRKKVQAMALQLMQKCRT